MKNASFAIIFQLLPALLAFASSCGNLLLFALIDTMKNTLLVLAAFLICTAVTNGSPAVAFVPKNDNDINIDQESKDGELKNGMGTQSLIDLGEFGTKKYYTVDRRLNWCDAKTFCSVNNMKLLRVSTVEEGQFIDSVTTQSYHWTSGIEIMIKDKFLWDSHANDTIEVDHFCNFDTGYYCLLWHYGLALHTAACTGGNYLICELDSAN